ncbi:MAG: alpha-2-macroglobulin family protein [Taibaiella sp.]|nr:alpha-2-macroglobulin family protein [Taibaiella sp.]
MAKSSHSTWRATPIALVVFFFSCRNGNELEVKSMFDPEIEQQQNLEFSVNHDVVPDSMLNKWDSTQYLELSPAVKGMFKWSTTNTLVFSPASKFEPGTEYTATPSKLLTRYSKKKYGVSDVPIKFHTAQLRVDDVHMSWTRAANQTDIVVQMDMRFNYEVELADAASHLKLSAAGRQIAIGQANTGKGNTLSIQFPLASEKDEEIPVKIDVSGGIPVAGSAYKSTKDTSMEVAVPSRYNLVISEAAAQHTGTEGVITVSTSQPILVESLKYAVTISPSVPFDIAINDGGFTIKGSSFSPTQVYELSISPKIQGAFGGRQKSGYTTSISFGKLKPSITFSNNKGMYITNQGFKNIALNIINVPSVEVSVVKVFENNLEQFMRRGTYYDYHYDREEEEGSSFEYYETGDLGDTIFSKVYETNKLPRKNAASILHLDFQDRISNYNGVYVLCVKSRDHFWVQQSKIMSISDIGLIVKKGDDGVHVFANSIHTTEPMSGVNVSFVSTTNQKVYTGTTNGDGYVAFKEENSMLPSAQIGMVTAKKQDDFSFVWLDKTRIGTSRYDVGGRIPNAADLIAMIHPERDLYRPGETIHLEAIVRDEQWQVQSGIPVRVRLVMPSGKEFSSVRKMLNEQGSCDVSFSPPNSTMTGTYVVEVYTGNDVLLNSHRISIEDFMPDRLKVNVQTDKTEYKPGDRVTVNIQADNLYGTPAANKNYECVYRLSKGTFSSDRYPDYSFAIHNDINAPEETKEGKTDAKGAASENFDISAAMIADAGIVNGNVTATVFDETGRPLHRYAHFNVYTQPVFVGIKSGDEYVSSKTPVRMGLICLDKKGNIQTGEAEVVVVRREWHTVLQRNGDSYRYVSQSEDRVVERQKVMITGAGTHYTFFARQSGEYEVRVFVKGAAGYVSRSLYAYGWGDTDYSSFEVDNEGSVEIKADKKQYNTGENVNVMFNAPFEGKLLVTLERSGVLKHYYLHTKNKAASLSFAAGSEMLPNVYVTATLVRPMDGSDMPLTVAHGFKSVPITDTRSQLAVDITVAEKSRSRTKQTIKVKTAPGAYVVVAAVDEGILQIRNFATPDPYGFFYQKVALTVNSYDIYPWLMPEIKTSLSSTGGDGMGYDGSRVNPLFVNRVKNVSFWSGILQADGGGNVRYDIDIPQFSGDIRVMAVAYKDKAFGSADKHMKVADPVVISTALPRFLSPGDEISMPVSVSNTTSSASKATVTVELGGQLAINGGAAREIDLPANKEQRAVFKVTAQPAIGAGKVVVTVKANGETFTNETELSIRPPASLQKITGGGFAPAGKATAIDVGNNFLPISFAGKITLGKSPVTQFSKHLEDLVQYPYGCVEQTTSAAFPQLYYADLARSVGGINNPNMNPAYNVQQAIAKLQSMQVGNGALTYWPQGGEESWWGSVYAYHFLLEARKAGYEVGDHTLRRLRDYLKSRLYKKELQTYYYNGLKEKNVAPSEVPYSLYVLALAGKPELSDMNYYKAHKELLTLDGKYLLAAAYTLAGMPAQGNEVRPPAFAGEQADRSLGGSFHSYLRDLALSLNVMMETDPKNRQVGTMARQLSEQLAREHWVNTQEKAYSLLALGKVARQANQTNAIATVSSAGRTFASTPGETITVKLDRNATNPAINVTGTGGFYYAWEISGISADGKVREEDSYMRVRRSFMDRNGRELGNTFKQNDLVVVHITIQSQNDVTLENVAITDMLPAGFEVENTRLNSLPEMEWIKKRSTPDYTDIRDDRVNMFTTVTETKKDFYYMVRAVSPGTYKLGPVQADAMYDGKYHSYNGAGTIRITE